MTTELVGDLLPAMLGCASSVLDPPVGRTLVASGATVAWDDCCDGQLWVRLASLAPIPGSGPCGVLAWAAVVEVGVIRCAAVLDDEGNAPPPGVLTAEAAAQFVDMTTLANAIQCCMVDLPRVEKLVIGVWAPLGPEGGCVGGQWSVTVRVNNCACPVEVVP